MLTQKMILLVGDLHEKLSGLQRLTAMMKPVDLSQQFAGVLADQTIAILGDKLEEAVKATREALVEALAFFQTDLEEAEATEGYLLEEFALPVAEIISRFQSDERDQLSAWIALTIFRRYCHTRVQDAELARLPLQRYRVHSRFGHFDVEEKSGDRARVKACETHYGRPFEGTELQMRDFAYGVVVERTIVGGSDSSWASSSDGTF